MSSRWLIVMVLTATFARAETPPTPSSSTLNTAAPFSLWEAGVMGGGGFMPDYPAAGQNHFKAIGAPYIVYRGRIVRADREGVRTRLLKTPVYEVDLGFAASFASRSRDNHAREGMPDLDYLLELGPRLNFKLSDLGGLGKLLFFLPARAVFSTDFSNFHHRGYTLTPALNGRIRLGKRPDRLFISQLSSSFGDRQICAYFYDVAPAFARPRREFYDARAGYIGTDLFTGVLLPVHKDVRMFTGVQVLLHSGAANESSPLFKNPVNYSLATALVWTFYRSPKPAAFLE